MFGRTRKGPRIPYWSNNAQLAQRTTWICRGCRCLKWSGSAGRADCGRRYLYCTAIWYDNIGTVNNMFEIWNGYRPQQTYSIYLSSFFILFLFLFYYIILNLLYYPGRAMLYLTVRFCFPWGLEGWGASAPLLFDLPMWKSFTRPNLRPPQKLGTCNLQGFSRFSLSNFQPFSPARSGNQLWSHIIGIVPVTQTVTLALRPNRVYWRFRKRPSIPVLSRWTLTGDCLRFYMRDSQRWQLRWFS